MPGPAALACVLAAAGVAPGAVSPLAAQDDVELLGRVHGTTPPPAYYEMKARNPDAFRFSRGWMARNPSLRREAPAVPGAPPRFRFREAGGADAGAGLLAPGARSVAGTFHLPLILGEFAGGDGSAYTRAEVQAEFFDGPNSRYATIEEYYAEISGGRIDFQGQSHPWVVSSLTRQQVAGSSQGLLSDARVGEFIVEILATLDDGSVDWGLYDNDGPDGVPNSGDDDGFVDILAVMHSTWGAECGGTGAEFRVWSHKWDLNSAFGDPFVTGTPSASADADFIRVNDYAIQPVETCGGGEINEIGVLAHELGHGFGLPDLYAVGSGHAGIGEWGLMGSGSWGCRGDRAERPCHMSAWSKSILGWVDVVTLGPDQDHGEISVPPVADPAGGGPGPLYRVDAGDGSGEYYLLENRQPVGFDTHLHAPGLLVWQVDPARVAARWASNTVNSTASHMGVWLRQADGHDHLGAVGGGRGDAGDPFPGSSGNTEFHAGSDPSSFTHPGSSAGLTMLDLELAGGDARFRLLTRYQTLAVSIEGDESQATLLVDGASVPTTGHSFPSAPFEEHRIVAQGGEPAGDGLRIGFEWADAPDQSRDRTWVTGLEDAALVARFGDLETRMRLDVVGGSFGVAPGGVNPTPPAVVEADGRWFRQGTMVSLEAVPNTGYGFVSWSGAAEGQGNPAVVDMSEPADVGLTFDLTYAVADNGTAGLVAGRSESVLLAAENGVPPLTWHQESGEAPEGMTLRPAGRIAGVPLEDGAFVVQVRAVDSRGLEAAGVVALDVSAPALGGADLTAPLIGRAHGLSQSQMDYLDFSGNGNGVYDLGDFRSFVLAHPDRVGASAAPVPSPAPGADPSPRVLRVLRFAPGGGS